MDDIIDRHADQQGYEEIQEDKAQRVEEIILTIASREPSLPYPLSLARACVAAMKREGLL